MEKKQVIACEKMQKHVDEKCKQKITGVSKIGQYFCNLGFRMTNQSTDKEIIGDSRTVYDNCISAIFLLYRCI